MLSKQEFQVEVFKRAGIPNVKEIRLAVDIAKQCNPMFARDKHYIAKTAIDMCDFNTSVDRVLRIKPFKLILFKQKLVANGISANGKIKLKTIKVRNK